MTDPGQPGTSIDCAEIVELVTNYLEGVLDEPTTTEFEAHLALCDGCDTYLEQMRETIRTLGHLHVESLSDKAVDELRSAFRDFHGLESSGR
jgi:anti-sigma factor RsiW